MPSFLAVSLAIASASPVTILIFTPILTRGRDGRLGILPGRIEQGQYADKLPLPISLSPRYAQGTKTARREFVDRLVNGRFYLRGIRRQFQDHLRRALGYLELFSVRPLDGGLGAFMHRVERQEMSHLIGL